MLYKYLKAAIGFFLFSIISASSAFGAGKIIDSDEFKTGKFRLHHSWMGKGAWGANDLYKLFLKQDWAELVDQMAEKEYVSNIYYFYLGHAAEQLGYQDAAIEYFKASTDPSVYKFECGIAFFSCHGLSFPNDSKNAIDRILNKEVREFLVMFSVLSPDGAPVEGAQIRITSLKDGITSLKDGMQPICQSDSGGICGIKVVATRNDVIKAVIEKEGSFPTNIAVKLSSSAHNNIVKLVDFSYYYCDSLKSSAETTLPLKLGVFAADIMLTSKFQKATLSREGICISEFKKRKYIALSLDHDVTFNDIKLNNYAIGVEIFDAVIRKIVTPLASTKVDIPSDGYDISVSTTKRNFVEAFDPEKKLVYRFYLSKIAVQQYKDKDITGQQLIDSSVVLLNDERIDLKLQ
jgi:hypothetical protein